MSLSIVFLIVAGLFAVRLIFLRTQDKASVVIPVCLCLIALMFCGGLMNEGLSPAGSVTGSQSAPMMAGSGEDTGQFVSAMSGDLSDSAAQSLQGESAAAPVSEQALRIEETKHGNMLVLLLSASVLEDFLGPEGHEALQSLSGAVSPQLRQAYALVPLPGPVDDAVPGIHALASAIAHVAEKSRAPGTAEAEAPPAVEAAGRASTDVSAMPERPHWIDNPGEGRVVVRAEAIEAGEPIEPVVESAVAQQLLETCIGIFSSQTGRPVGTFPDRSLTMTEDAVAACVCQQYIEPVVIDTLSGPVTMQLTFALVEFPDAIKSQGVASLRESLQHQRTWSIGVAAAGLGLIVMLVTGMLQLSAARGRWTRMTGITLLTLILLSGLAVTGQLVRSVASSGSLPLPEWWELTDAVITAADS